MVSPCGGTHGRGEIRVRADQHVLPLSQTAQEIHLIVRNVGPEDYPDGAVVHRVDGLVAV
jgi:hypothetical protein